MAQDSGAADRRQGTIGKGASTPMADNIQKTAMHSGTVSAKSFDMFTLNQGLLARCVDAVKEGDRLARQSGQVQSFEVFRNGFRMNLVIGRIMVVPPSVCDDKEGFPVALLYGALVKQIQPEDLADLMAAKIGDSEFDEYSEADMQEIKDKLFRVAGSKKFASLVLFLPSWTTPREYVMFKFTKDDQALANALRHLVFAAYFDPALSSAFNSIMQDTDTVNHGTELDVTNITPKINFPGVAEGAMHEYPKLESADDIPASQERPTGADKPKRKRASAGKLKIAFTATSANEAIADILSEGEVDVLDAVTEAAEAAILNKRETPAAVADHDNAAKSAADAGLRRRRDYKVSSGQIPCPHCRNKHTEPDEDALEDHIARAHKNAAKAVEYQPKTGEPCSCRPGQQRENCPQCEGTGQKIDFAAIRNRNKTAQSGHKLMEWCAGTPMEHVDHKRCPGVVDGVHCDCECHEKREQEGVIASKVAAKHSWADGKCDWCGVNWSVQGQDKECPKNPKGKKTAKDDGPGTMKIKLKLDLNDAMGESLAAMVGEAASKAMAEDAKDKNDKEKEKKDKKDGKKKKASAVEERVALEGQYSLNPAGGISNLGKFEGEPLYVPYFYDLWNNASADEDFGNVGFFKVSPEDTEAFPELVGTFGVVLEETEQGFVNSTTYADEAEYNAAVERVSAEGGEGDEEYTASAEPRTAAAKKAYNPGQEAYVYQAALVCKECGDEIKRRLAAEGKAPADPEDEHSFDSDEYPKGPYAEGGGESDVPEHCDACGKFLENPLTQHGYDYLRELVADARPDNQGAIDELVAFYPEAFEDRSDEPSPEVVRQFNEEHGFPQDEEHEASADKTADTAEKSLYCTECKTDVTPKVRGGDRYCPSCGRIIFGTKPYQVKQGDTADNPANEKGGDGAIKVKTDAEVSKTSAENKICECGHQMSDHGWGGKGACSHKGCRCKKAELARLEAEKDILGIGSGAKAAGAHKPGCDCGFCKNKGKLPGAKKDDDGGGENDGKEASSKVAKDINGQYEHPDAVRARRNHPNFGKDLSASVSKKFSGGYVTRDTTGEVAAHINATYAMEGSRPMPGPTGPMAKHGGEWPSGTQYCQHGCPVENHDEQGNCHCTECTDPTIEPCGCPPGCTVVNPPRGPEENMASSDGIDADLVGAMEHQLDGAQRTNASSEEFVSDRARRAQADHEAKIAKFRRTHVADESDDLLAGILQPMDRLGDEVKVEEGDGRPELSKGEAKDLSGTTNPKAAAVAKVAYVAHVPGHKNSKGEAAPWVIKDHKDGHIISSHGSEAEAKKHLQDMHAHSGADKTAASIPYDVYIDGTWVNRVFDQERDPEEVKRSLVSHDGYPSNIEVRRGGKRIPKGEPWTEEEIQMGRRRCPTCHRAHEAGKTACELEIPESEPATGAYKTDAEGKDPVGKAKADIPENSKPVQPIELGEQSAKTASVDLDRLTAAWLGEEIDKPVRKTAGMTMTCPWCKGQASKERHEDPFVCKCGFRSDKKAAAKQAADRVIATLDDLLAAEPFDPVNEERPDHSVAEGLVSGPVSGGKHETNDTAGPANKVADLQESDLRSDDQVVPNKMTPAKLDDIQLGGPANDTERPNIDAVREQISTAQEMDKHETIAERQKEVAEGAAKGAEPEAEPATETIEAPAGSGKIVININAMWLKAHGLADPADGPVAEPKNVEVYDNGGETADRYTIVFKDLPETYAGPDVYAAVAMGDDIASPQGFYQHVEAIPGGHLGKRIPFSRLPEEHQRAIMSELEADDPQMSLDLKGAGSDYQAEPITSGMSNGNFGGSGATGAAGAPDLARTAEGDTLPNLAVKKGSDEIAITAGPLAEMQQQFFSGPVKDLATKGVGATLPSGGGGTAGLAEGVGEVAEAIPAMLAGKEAAVPRRTGPARPTTPSQNHNGWHNWETWHIALLIDNTEQSYNTKRNLVRSALKAAKGGQPDIDRLADQFSKLFAAQAKETKDYADQNARNLPDSDWGGPFEVNWHEIAENAVDAERDEERAASGANDPAGYEARVQALEAEGLTRGDAQAAVEAEIAKGKKASEAKRAGFNFWFPGQVLREFYPEVQHELVDYPNADNKPMIQDVDLAPEKVGAGEKEAGDLSLPHPKDVEHDPAELMDVAPPTAQLPPLEDRLRMQKKREMEMSAGSEKEADPGRTTCKHCGRKFDSIQDKQRHRCTPKDKKKDEKEAGTDKEAASKGTCIRCGARLDLPENQSTPAERANKAFADRYCRRCLKEKPTHEPIVEKTSDAKDTVGGPEARRAEKDLREGLEGELGGVYDSEVNRRPAKGAQKPDLEYYDRQAGEKEAGSPQYTSTDPGAIGIGRDGKPQVLEGAPLRKEWDIRGPMFSDEFYANYPGVPGRYLAMSGSFGKKAATPGGQKEMLGDFLKKVVGEIAVTFCAAYKVTSRPVGLDRVPGTGEVNLVSVENSVNNWPFYAGEVGGRVKFLLEEMNDSDIRDAINDAWAQASVWHSGSASGNFTYEVFVRAESIDTDSMTLKYKFVTGTKGD